MNTRKPVPGAGSEPAEVASSGSPFVGPNGRCNKARHDPVHTHRVTFQRVGWAHWAFCSCGWIASDADVPDLSIKAACHGVGSAS